MTKQKKQIAENQVESVSFKGTFEQLVKLSVADTPQIKKQPAKKAAKKKDKQ